MLWWVLWILASPLALAAALVYFLLLTILVLPIRADREYEKHSRFYRALLVYSTGFAMWLGRVRIQVAGRELLPPQGRFLLVCNHRSKFDPLITWWALRRYDLAFISKASNFRVPWFGRIIRKCCFMAIDRENPRRALTTIRRAAALLEADEVSVAVYPEGTRSPTAALLPFHCGVFKIAQQAGVPIVVAAISGSERLHRTFFLRPAPVRLEIAAVLPAEAVRQARTAALGEEIRAIMESSLQKEVPAPV